MGTPREIHSTEAATGHPPVWNEWMTFSDDPSGLVGVDGLEFRVRAEAKVMGRSMDLGAVVLSMKEVWEEALETQRSGTNFSAESRRKKKRRGESFRSWYPLLKESGGELQ